MYTPTIEKHYVDNRQRLMKKMTFRAGTHEAAEDVLQEAYYRALRYQNSFDGSNFGKWFSTILNNSLREYKNVEKGYSLEEFVEEDAEGFSCRHYPDQVMREVFDLIETKSEVQKEVLGLFFRQEYSAMDISRITDYSYAQCHQIIQRFRNELKDLYRE